MSDIKENQVMVNRMDGINSVWLLLCPDAVSCCNEPFQSKPAGTDFMPLELLKKIVKEVKYHSWNCVILGNRNEIPKEYRSCFDEIKPEIILPADYTGNLIDGKITIVFDSSQMEYVKKYPSGREAVLRLQRRHLSELSTIVTTLLGNFSNVSIRHPELPSYNEQDMIIYKEQLIKIGLGLIDKKQSWLKDRVHNLTDGFQLTIVEECGAGISSIAVGPTGELYLCPAAAQDGAMPYGHILETLTIPNRHLLTREYSLPCGKCNALHCRRCVYLHKRSTFEYCVPSKNACLLAHHELEAQAWIAREAIKKGLWDDSFTLPDFPEIYDPYELIKVEEAQHIANSWHRLVAFDGRPQRLRSAMMLDILHELQGWCHALTICANTGKAPSINLIQQDVLSSLRRRTIERYRDIVFDEDCPTIMQIELLMCEAANKFIDFSNKVSLWNVSNSHELGGN